MRAKLQRIVIDNCGSYLGMQKGCFVVKDREGNVQRFPMFENEIGEIVLTGGNFVSTSVLASCGFWDIPITIMTKNFKPIAVLKSLDDDSHVKTRIAQYEALKNGKGITIAKTIVESKIESQNIILKRYSLKQLDIMTLKAKIEKLESNNLKDLRKRLLPIEGKASEHYFHEIFKLFPKAIRTEQRKTWKAYDSLNNTFNLAYTLLKFRVHSAILKAHLEPYLGFMHSEQHGKPSLVCDFCELYRYIIDSFLIDFSQNLKPKDFIVKTEWYSTNRLGKRQVLNREKTKELTENLNRFFETKVPISRIRYGFKQQIETLINEEALLFAKYLRDEREQWIPRIIQLNPFFHPRFMRMRKNFLSF
ncbi:MAG: CRISPR-associated endonuclease Cas1 [Candidatus Bathyarchaeia archaeon]